MHGQTHIKFNKLRFYVGYKTATGGSSVKRTVLDRWEQLWPWQHG